jgi:hypothetical protein
VLVPFAHAFTVAAYEYLFAALCRVLGLTPDLALDVVFVGTLTLILLIVGGLE